ncbi:MAG: sensor histidine kinase [Actinobacteria bacterium]|nr:sensor histidine kinase [Actinomycetota bacterium]
MELLVVLLLPLLALAAVVGVEVQDRRGDASEAQNARRLVELVGTGNDLRDGVQLQVALAALPQTNDIARRLRTAQLETEADIRTLNMALAGFDLASYGPGFAAAIESVETALRNYEAASPKARTDGELAGALTNALVDDLGSAAARTITNDGELARSALGYTSLLVANERRADLFHRITQAVAGGPVTRESLRGITGQQAEEEVALEIFRTTASSGQRADLADVSQDRTAATAKAAIDSVEETAVGSPLAVDTTTFVPAMERRIRLLESFTRSVGRDIERVAAGKRDAAERSALLYLAIGIAAIVVAFGLAVVFLISIVRRLNQLAAGAHYFAERQLPAIVASLRDPKATEGVIGESILLERLGSDEIGEVGRAFNSVQSTFAGVAKDHAELLRKGIGDIFVKLARRNQSLVERQIELLDELESAEKDPDVLENLFKLDHLATRVRRNAESLLVLAGSEPSRRWSDPVPLDELLQGAMSEIEDYRRIQVASGSVGNTVEVVGAASLDIAHLFAELLDNAVRFSPPDTAVEVLVRRREETCMVYVSDTGMGMSDEQLEEANELLANPPEPGLDLSRTLGLYVAGRLAARHGVTVRLARSAYDGIVASVSLPPELVMDVPVREPRPVAAAGTNGHGDGVEVQEPPAVVASAEPHPNGEAALVAGALPQRVQAILEPRPVEPAPVEAMGERTLGAAPSTRTPDERRHHLSSFLRRLDEGRASETPEPGVAEEQAS